MHVSAKDKKVCNHATCDFNVLPFIVSVCVYLIVLA